MLSHGKDGCIEVKKCIVGDMCWGGERWERGAGSSGGLYDRATSGIDNERGREGDSGAGSSSVTVSRVRWVSLVICVGQAGVCTVIYP